MDSDQISKKIGKLINEIDRSLEKKEQDKAVQVADADLIFMKMELSKMKVSIETNEFSTTKKAYATLSRVIADSWPWESRIGAQISEVDHDFINYLKAKNLI